MRPLLLTLSLLFAGCTTNPPADRTARHPPPQHNDPRPPEQRESSARANIAAGRDNARDNGPRDRAQGADAAQPQTWRGLDLSAAPVTTDASRLPDLWEERPPGSGSYEIRDDVTVIRPDNLFTDGTVYWLKPQNRFYVQRDPLASSTHSFYGPFAGDPYEVLDPPPNRAADE